jgi:hypothetical protein
MYPDAPRTSDSLNNIHLGDIARPSRNHEVVDKYRPFHHSQSDKSGAVHRSHHPQSGMAHSSTAPVSLLAEIFDNLHTLGNFHNIGLTNNHHAMSNRVAGGTRHQSSPS